MLSFNTLIYLITFNLTVLDENKVLDSLPKKMRSDIAKKALLDTLCKVKIFQVNERERERERENMTQYSQRLYITFKTKWI